MTDGTKYNFFLSQSLKICENGSSYLYWVKSFQIRRFFWSKYGKIRNRKNLVFGHFLRSADMNVSNISTIRSSRPGVFCKKGALWNSAKFTEKQMCHNLFFNKVAGLRPEKRLWHRWCPVNFAKFLRTPLFTERLRWLLLYYHYSEVVHFWICCINIITTTLKFSARRDNEGWTFNFVVIWRLAPR